MTENVDLNEVKKVMKGVREAREESLNHRIKHLEKANKKLRKGWKK